jgi:hypothetical protein
VPLNGSKDITLAASESELKCMSTSAAICDQDIGGLEWGETGEMRSSWVFLKGEREVYIAGEGTGSGRRTWSGTIFEDVCQGGARGEDG